MPQGRGRRLQRADRTQVGWRRASAHRPSAAPESWHRLRAAAQCPPPITSPPLRLSILCCDCACGGAAAASPSMLAPPATARSTTHCTSLLLPPRCVQLCAGRGGRAERHRRGAAKRGAPARLVQPPPRRDPRPQRERPHRMPDTSNCPTTHATRCRILHCVVYVSHSLMQQRAGPRCSRCLKASLLPPPHHRRRPLRAAGAV